MIKTDQYELMWIELKEMLQEIVIYGNCVQYGICSGLIGKMEEIEEKHKEPNK